MKSGLFISSGETFFFDFEGRRIRAFVGDTVASALWRDGVRTLSRSFKYHRRRGVLSMCGADANTLMDIDGSPNARADVTLATAGMIVRPRRCAGGVENDRFAMMRWLSPFLPPGFYYKSFYQPRGSWPLWEILFRRMAGMGVVNTASHIHPVPKIHDFCDVAVIGGGVAGMAAASAAVKKGKTVRLLDRNPKLGGALNWRGGDNGFHNSNNLDNVKTYLSCEATSVFADNFIAAKCHDYVLRLRADEIIYATGARDMPLVFANNDLPGVMLLSAALRLAFLYDVACGGKAAAVVGAAADADALRLLQQYGVTVAAVFNIGEPNNEWAEALSADGFTVYHHVAEFAAKGGDSVSGVRALCGGRRVEVSCDTVLMNGGTMPNAELPAGAGVKFNYNPQLRRPIAEDNCLAGAVNNRCTIDSAKEDGTAAGNGGSRPPADNVASPDRVIYATDGMAFVDYEHDLRPKDLEDAVDEGFDDIQLLKRYTTAGMGPAQGKLGNMLVLRHLATKRNCSPETLGQITARPPAAEETLAQMANEPHPVRRSALHRAHVHLSAKFMPAGAWLRPAHYGDIEAESLAVRNELGIIDISTLGKMQISGEDAAEFLHRFYAGSHDNQKPNTVRYALLLDESGFIVDDGVAARLNDGRFWVTTTTGNSDAVYRQMLLWRARWGLRADILNMTSAYAAVNLAGPEAPSILSELWGDNADLPPMRAAEVPTGDSSAIIMRTGFVGEKGCEIHIPSGYAMALWNKLSEKARPFGVEAQRLLRLEKGHIIVGQDTDGITTPLEANMEWALGKNKDFYLGKRALDIHRARGIKQKLFGFVMDLHRHRVDESDLVINTAGEVAGRVTSVSYSPTLQRIIGLAYGPPETPATGGVLHLRAADGEVMEAQTMSPPFYAPKKEAKK